MIKIKSKQKNENVPKYTHAHVRTFQYLVNVGKRRFQDGNIILLSA